MFWCGFYQADASSYKQTIDNGLARSGEKLGNYPVWGICTKSSAKSRSPRSMCYVGLALLAPGRGHQRKYSHTHVARQIQISKRPSFVFRMGVIQQLGAQSDTIYRPEFDTSEPRGKRPLSSTLRAP